MAVVVVGDRPQRRLVVGDRRRTRQREDPGGGIPCPGDPVLSGNSEGVFTVHIVRGHRHRRRRQVGAVDVGHRDARIQRCRTVLGVCHCCDRGCHHRGVVDGSQRDRAARRCTAGKSVVGNERHRSGGGGRVVAAVVVGDRAQCRLVVGDGRVAREGEHTGRSGPRAGDPVLGGQGEGVLAIDVGRGHRHRRRRQVGAVGVGDRDRRIQHGRSVLGVRHAARCRRHHGSIVDRCDGDRAGRHSAARNTVADDERHRANGGVRAVAVVVVRDRTQCRLVVGDGR